MLMAYVFLLLILALGVVCGLGIGVRVLVEKAQPGYLQAASLGDVGLLGLIGLAIVCTTINFFMPLSAPVTGIIAIAGLILLVGKRADVAACASVRGSPVICALALGVLALAITPYIYWSASTHYDTGLYHLQVILQAIDAPVTLGGANIHYRFGYNSLWFLAAAGLTAPGFGLTGAYLVNPLAMVFVTLGTTQHLIRCLCTAGHSRSAFFGVGLCCVLLSPSFLFSSLGSPNSDVVCALLILYCAFLSLVLSDTAVTDASGRHHAAATGLMIPLLASFAVVTKLSALPIAAVSVFVLLGWRRGTITISTLRLVAAICIPIVILWVARGIATSGCIAYPNPNTCLDLPWRVNLATAQSDMDWMRAWARQPGIAPELVLGNWNWFSGWLQDFSREPFRKVIIMIALIAAGGLLARVAFRDMCTTVWGGLSRSQRHDSILLIVLAIAGLSFWFFTAPLVRYGQSWLILPVLLLMAHVAPSPARSQSLLMFMDNFLLEAAAILADRERRRLFFCKNKGHVRKIAAVGAVFWIALHLGRWGDLVADDFPRIPAQPVTARLAESGLNIYVPAAGEQCWAAPRPCTPYFSHELDVERLGYWLMIKPR